jgi:hypothetical protein
MGSHPTLDPPASTEEKPWYYPWDFGSAFSYLKRGEDLYACGLVTDAELLHRRELYLAYKPSKQPPSRWSQRTLAELRADGWDAEADRILGLQREHHQIRELAAGGRAFDRLNPEFGQPADQLDPYGRQDVQQREAALALGVRVAIHDSRQNDPNPHVWQPGQDYRAAEAIQAARRQPTRTRQGPERLGPER